MAGSVFYNYPLANARRFNSLREDILRGTGYSHACKGVVYGGDPQTLLQKQKIRAKIVIRAKFGWVKSVKIPFGHEFIFNLRIRAAKTKVQHTRPE